MHDLAQLHEQELDLLDELDAADARSSLDLFHLRDRLDAVHAAIREAEWHAQRAAALADRRIQRKRRHAA